MAKKTYNPYRLAVILFNRFRGIVNGDNPLSIEPAYVESSSGIISNKIAEMIQQPAVVFNESHQNAIDTGWSVKGLVILSVGTSILYGAENLGSSSGTIEQVCGTLPTEDQSANISANTVKTYMRRVFSPKLSSWIGIDQGKGVFYRGHGVQNSFGLVYDDNSIQPQNTVVWNESFAEGVDSAIRIGSESYLSSGTSIWVRT